MSSFTGCLDFGLDFRMLLGRLVSSCVMCLRMPFRELSEYVTSDGEVVADKFGFDLRIPLVSLSASSGGGVFRIPKYKLKQKTHQHMQVQYKFYFCFKIHEIVQLVV